MTDPVENLAADCERTRTIFFWPSAAIGTIAGVAVAGGAAAFVWVSE